MSGRLSRVARRRSNAEIWQTVFSYSMVAQCCAVLYGVYFTVLNLERIFTTQTTCFIYHTYRSSLFARSESHRLDSTRLDRSLTLSQLASIVLRSLYCIAILYVVLCNAKTVQYSLLLCAGRDILYCTVLQALAGCARNAQ